ncbi:MAG: hypothetical protein F2668_09155 [Actinobacteria bacterium]|uniref:Unannotated protein n=1 Tax=freshwater metagenome TaxID=449393 RepID=A0A6J6R0I3_9ZZZZ|nr:hypothetical protein [Actinomycetota bacterium]
MKSRDAMRILDELSASQWGMLTTAQAAAHGVPRLDLSRLSQAGHLERLAYGVYRNAGAPSEEFKSLRAEWLAADPSHTAEQRLLDVTGGVVVMGQSATSLHGVGDLAADRHEFSTPVRRQTQRTAVSYRWRQLDRGDVTIARGLPVTTIERTIADLVQDRTDLSLVAGVLQDAAQRRRLNTDRLTELLAPFAPRNNLRKDDGAALLNRLTAIAGLDTASLVEEISSSETLSALVAANSLSRFTHVDLSDAVTGPATQKALREFNESVARSVQQSMAPVLEALAGSIEMPRMAGLDVTLAEMAKQVSLNLPTQNLLASFGKEWAASLTTAVAAAGADLPSAKKFIEAARHVEAVATSG